MTPAEKSGPPEFLEFPGEIKCTEGEKVSITVRAVGADSGMFVTDKTAKASQNGDQFTFELIPNIEHTTGLFVLKGPGGESQKQIRHRLHRILNNFDWLSR